MKGLHVSAKSREEAAVEVKNITRFPQFAGRFGSRSAVTFEDVRAHVIYCIAFNDLVAHLRNLGFIKAEGTPDVAIFV